MTLDVVAFTCGAALLAFALLGGSLSLPFLKVEAKGKLPPRTLLACVAASLAFLATGVALHRAGGAEANTKAQAEKTAAAEGAAAAQAPAPAAGTSAQPAPPSPAGSAAPLAVYVLDSSGGEAGDNTCEYPVVIPASFRPSADLRAAGQKVLRALENGSASAWARAPEGDGRVTALVEIGSRVKERTWLRLENTFRVTVRARSPDAEAVDVLSTCAGEGRNNVSPRIVHLRADGPREYVEEVAFPHADFFTLMPGEFESFVFTFQCRTPGVFAVAFEVPYTLAGRRDRFRFPHADLVCPRSAYYWERWDAQLSGGDELHQQTYAEAQPGSR